MKLVAMTRMAIRITMLIRIPHSGINGQDKGIAGTMVSIFMAFRTPYLK